jgi:hypothetical protein
LGENYVGQRTVSRGNNLSDDGSCNLNQESDQENTEPLLTPIADDDEPNALVFEPQPYSPVMNMAANRTRAQVDQRGAKRPQDGNGDGSSICDVGSVEARPPSSGG